MIASQHELCLPFFVRVFNLPEWCMPQLEPLFALTINRIQILQQLDLSQGAIGDNRESETFVIELVVIA